jgi:hypothetical protein
MSLERDEYFSIEWNFTDKFAFLGEFVTFSDARGVIARDAGLHPTLLNISASWNRTL